MTLHRISDVVRAQRLGTWIWTISVVITTLADACASVLAPAEVCVPTQDRFLLTYEALALTLTLITLTLTLTLTLAPVEVYTCRPQR